MSQSTADAAEIEKFARMARDWWDPEGAFRPLHRMNPARLDFVRDQVCAQFGRDPRKAGPLKGLSVVDVGCGGGLLCEPMARLGADVTGVDAAEEGVEAARLHAGEMGLDIDYRAGLAGALAEEGARFDVVLAMEVVEHVPDIDGFLRDCAALLKPGGIMLLSTLNRTARSYLLAILGAEYLLRWLPQGTHDWRRFPTPQELEAALRNAGMETVDSTGFAYDPMRDDWRMNADLSVNYALCAAPIRR